MIPTISYQNDPLWLRLSAFELDDKTSAFPFSSKLAQENNWTAEFTQRAIAEYKRFIYLCCTQENGASPSAVIDSVWHLHLQYSENYWKEFCPNVLQKALHHHPSKGGLEEQQRHKVWFQKTLTAYKYTFGNTAPNDIWKDNFNITSQENIPLIDAQIQVLNLQGWGLLAVYLLLGFVMPILLDKTHIFALKGMMFFIPYIIMGLVAMIGSYFLAKESYSLTIKRLSANKNIHTLPNFFQIDKSPKSLNTLLLDALTCKEITVVNHQTISVHLDKNEGNPSLLHQHLIPYNGKKIDPRLLYSYQPASHGQLVKDYFGVNNWGHSNIALWVIGVIHFVLGVSRLSLGIMAGKPVLFLVILLGITAIMAYFTYSSAHDNSILDYFEPLQENILATHLHPTALAYFQQGKSAITKDSPFASILFLSSFSLANYSNYHYRNSNSGSGGSSCSGSSCSCGSSCGSSCGGGCGGCGGD